MRKKTKSTKKNNCHTLPQQQKQQSTTNIQLNLNRLNYVDQELLYGPHMKGYRSVN